MTARKKSVAARGRPGGATVRGSGRERASAPTPSARSGSTGRRLSPDERRAQIVDIVEELFKTRPYAQVGIADVAAAARVTEGLVYHYFPSKEALFRAAFEVRAAELLTFCRPDPALPLMEQIERAVKGYIDFVEAHSVAYLNLFTGPAAGEEGIQQVANDTRWRIVDDFIEALALGRPLPVTRLSLRGYLGFSETVILEWLEHRAVPRATIERTLFAVVGASLLIGLAGEADPLPAEVLAERHVEYQRHFALP